MPFQREACEERDNEYVSGRGRRRRKRRRRRGRRRRMRRRI